MVEKITRLQGVWEDKLWENSWVTGAASGREIAAKGVRAELFQQNPQNKSVGREETSLQKFLTNHVEYFLVPIFCGSFCKSWRECPHSWRCLVVPWTKILFYYLTRWELHRVRFSNGTEILRWFETNVLGFETETCQGSWLRYLQYQRSKKKNTKEKQKQKRKKQRMRSN